MGKPGCGGWMFSARHRNARPGQVSPTQRLWVCEKAWLALISWRTIRWWRGRTRLRDRGCFEQMTFGLLGLRQRSSSEPAKLLSWATVPSTTNQVWPLMYFFSCVRFLVQNVSQSTKNISPNLSKFQSPHFTRPKPQDLVGHHHSFFVHLFFPKKYSKWNQNWR